MPQLTMRELDATMREFQGQPDAPRLDGRSLDTSLQDLGFDSLVLLQTTGRIQQRYGVEIDRDGIAVAETARELLEVMNSALKEVTA
jgi:act minimal PKS acyl carrier protein